MFPVALRGGRQSQELQVQAVAGIIQSLVVRGLVHSGLVPNAQWQQLWPGPFFPGLYWREILFKLERTTWKVEGECLGVRKWSRASFREVTCLCSISRCASDVWGSLNILVKFFFIWTMLHRLQDLSSLIRDWTCPQVKTLSLNHWTAREFSGVFFFF